VRFREHAPARDAADAVQKVLIHTENAFPGGDALRDRRISRDADTRRGQTQRGLGGEGDTSDTNEDRSRRNESASGWLSGVGQV
jgi:hypothetical protein